jgi:hypothetical protein
MEIKIIKIKKLKSKAKRTKIKRRLYIQARA